MNIEEMLQEQAKQVQQAYSDFEALKRIWEKSQGSTNDFETYTEKLDMGEAESPEEESAETYCMDDEDNEGPLSAWRDYMKMYATGEFIGEHISDVPPAKYSDYAKIDADDPGFAKGIQLGLPGSITLHVPYAGNLLPNIGRE